ncbi:MAG: 4Fe-4S dicluster domain-containing protein [Ignavibacteria bacterium]|nr:4Fe-4S dicluster domain-containing protein [Ignavibacteria bacterium]
MKTIIFTIILITAFTFFFYNLRRMFGYLKIGQKDNRFDKPLLRFKNVILIGIGQSKLLREPFAGFMHAFIFWGFLALIIVVVESIIQGFIHDFHFSGLKSVYSIITATQDIFSVLIVLSVLAAIYRRFIRKVERLKSEHDGNLDAAFILGMILIVITSMVAQNVFNTNISEYDSRFMSPAISANLDFSGIDVNFYYELFWWIHIVTIFVFVNYLPFSKHFHVITSLPNVYFAKLEQQRDQISPINLEDESLTHFGALDVEHLTWKQLFDGYTCTECGRCTSACPANNTGKTLSPRKVIMDIRQRVLDRAKQNSAITGEDQIKTLVHNYISDEEIWACTTCNACVHECPVMIEHVDSIVEMRRGLVLSEANFPNELNVVFKNFETNFTPWAFSYEERADWAEGLDIPIANHNNDAEYLFWVGCAGSFDERYKKVSRAFSQLMKKGGISFKILGKEEKCNGDAARRLGNEYLAQILMKENIQTLEKYNIKKIITACPHCFHSLKNEYKQFGGNYEVYHHSEIIGKLIKEGSINLQNELAKTVTYHDSCYLGRYNEIYDEPRNSISKINKVNLVEMNRTRDRGFCCGAGGGRMFLEETEGKRINVERVEEALKLKPDVIASACPFCMIMLNDGVKSFETASDLVEIKDISELILESL